MQTTNGTPNGAQSRPGFTRQPTTPVNGANPSTPVANNHLTAMRVPHRNAYTHQGPRAQPVFPVQHQTANVDGNTYEMTIRGSSSTPTPVAQGHAQNAQQAPQGRPGFPSHQEVNGNGWNPMLPMFNNPAAMNAIYQLVSAVTPQPGQPQHPQQFQSPQQYQTPLFQTFPQTQGPQQYGNPQQHGTPQQYGTSQQYGTPQQYQNPATDSATHANPSGGNVPTVESAPAPLSTNQAPRPANNMASSLPHPVTPGVEHHTGSDSPPDAGSPLNAGNAPDVGVAQPSQTSTTTETPEQFQTRVKALVAEKGNTFGGHIQNDADYRRFKQAVWEAKLSGGSYENRAQDYPQDAAGQSRVRQRIFDAFYNLDGDQDPASETGEFANCLAVKIVQGLSPIEVELLAHDLMVSLLMRRYPGKSYQC